MESKRSISADVTLLSSLKGFVLQLSDPLDPTILECLNNLSYNHNDQSKRLAKEYKKLVSLAEDDWFQFQRPFAITINKGYTAMLAFLEGSSLAYQIALSNALTMKHAASYHKESNDRSLLQVKSSLDKLSGTMTSYMKYIEGKSTMKEIRTHENTINLEVSASKSQSNHNIFSERTTYFQFDPDITYRSVIGDVKITKDNNIKFTVLSSKKESTITYLMQLKLGPTAWNLILNRNLEILCRYIDVHAISFKHYNNFDHSKKREILKRLLSDVPMGSAQWLKL